MMMRSSGRQEIKFTVSQETGEVSADLILPETSECLLILAHGAGAGMRHPFMEALSQQLAENGIASFRYQFPYMEHRSRRPDRAPVLCATVRAAVDWARNAHRDLPLLAGGKSMGGRMTSLAFADAALPDVRGLVFFGFPLHPAGTPGTDRAQHLARVSAPMLFLQGTRDKLAGLDLLEPVCRGLGERATLHVIEGADHSFHVLKSAGRSDSDVIAELARTVATWCSKL